MKNQSVYRIVKIATSEVIFQSRCVIEACLEMSKCRINEYQIIEIDVTEKILNNHKEERESKIEEIQDLLVDIENKEQELADLSDELEGLKNALSDINQAIYKIESVHTK